MNQFGGSFFAVRSYIVERMAEEKDSCVDEELFYEKLESLKASKKGKTSNLTVFVNDEFYDRAKAWLISSDSKENGGLSYQVKWQQLNAKNGLYIREK